MTTSCIKTFDRASESDKSLYTWVGTSNLLGFPTHVEANFIEQGDNIIGGNLSMFGETVRSYDVAVIQDSEIQNIERDGDSISFEFIYRKRKVRFNGIKFGDIIKGTLVLSEKFFSLTLYKTEATPASSLDKFHGLYQIANDTFLITPREYGGLRLIDLNQGISRTLLEVKKGHFTSRKALLKEDQPIIEFRFPKNKKKKIIGLLWKRDETEIFGKYIEGVDQQEFQFNGFHSQLSGTLLTPSGKGSFNTLVLVHGSGPIYRTALIEAAYRFVEMGYGAFIYDKRGTGSSTGNRENDNLQLLAEDAKEALEFIGAHSKVDKVGFQGHSQAGWVIPMAIAKGANPEFIIIVNGGSVDEGSQTVYDKRNDLIRQGFNKSQQKKALSILERVHRYVRDSIGDRQLLEADFLNAQKEPWFDVLDLPRFQSMPSWSNPPEEMVAFSKRLRYNPIEAQKQIKTPTLIVLGEKDETVPSRIVADGWRKSLSDNLTIKLFQNLGHDMRRASGNGRRLSETFLNYEQEWLDSVFPYKE